MHKKRLRDIVVLLPGIIGSVLQKHNKDIWSISGQAAWEWVRSLGSPIDDLRIAEDDPNEDDLGDGIIATRVMPDFHIVPGLAKIDGYSMTARMVTDNFEVIRGSLTDHRPANFFEFPYDWRRDNRVSARRLKTLIDRQLPVWRECRSGATDAKVVLIAHSMGGLICRHYLEVLDGWRDCRALITFGTPYRGSLDALGYLANGYKKLFLDLTALMSSFTSVYQLLPIYPVVRIGDAYRRVAETDGIAGIDPERASRALLFHRQIETAAQAHGKESYYLQERYKTVPVIGVGQPTLQSAEFTADRLELSTRLPDGIDSTLGDGDGRVPRLSAIPLELSDDLRETYAVERHGSLQSNRYVLADVLRRLEQMQVKGLEKIRGPTTSSVSKMRPGLAVELDDLYQAYEPVEIRAKLTNDEQWTGSLLARIDPLRTAEQEPIQQALDEDSDGFFFRKESLPPGVYRATITAAIAGPEAPLPVQDIFEVSG